MRFFKSSTEKLVISTAYGQVHKHDRSLANVHRPDVHAQLRVYDTKAQRRPVLDVQAGATTCSAWLLCYAADVACVRIGEHPFNCIDLSADENTLYAGDTLGNIACFDLRAAGACYTTLRDRVSDTQHRSYARWLPRLWRQCARIAASPHRTLRRLVRSRPVCACAPREDT